MWLEASEERHSNLQHDSPANGRWLRCPAQRHSQWFSIHRSRQRIYGSTVVDGTWAIKSGEARVIWNDGWKDKLLLQPDGTALKVAFEKGKGWDDGPHNRQPADKVPD